MRRFAPGLLVLTLLTALLVAIPGTVGATTLSSGTYTYVINGEEATFPYDPVKRTEGLLLPADVFQRLGISVEGALTREISLFRAGVMARLTLGSKATQLNGKPIALETAPLQLGGRLFLPADLLPHFGVEITPDGSYVFLREYLEEELVLKTYSAAEYAGLRTDRRIAGSVKSDSGFNLQGEFTLLTRPLLGAANLDLSYGDRARLLSLTETHTLVLVKLSNQTLKSGALQTSGLYLVDDKRSQYDLEDTLDLGQGLISGKLAPAADRVGVLLFPKASADALKLTLYYEANGASLGSFLRLN